MEIKTVANGAEMTVALEGRLDTSTAPQLEKELGTKLENVETLIWDFENLGYVSSAGLRVLLATQKKMNAKNGTMVIKHVNEMIMEIFDVTGFLDILTVEND
jgi:anti-sigma B factor antagonist